MTQREERDTVSRGRRRPFKVRGWSTHWNDYVGASFASREAAEARGILYVQAGTLDVRVWETDEDGYAVGPLRLITEAEAFATSKESDRER